MDEPPRKGKPPTATSMRSLATSSILRITFFSILTSWDSFLARSGPKAPPALRRRAWPALSVSRNDYYVGFSVERSSKRVRIGDQIVSIDAGSFDGDGASIYSTHPNFPFQRSDRTWWTTAEAAGSVYRIGQPQCQAADGREQRGRCRPIPTWSCDAVGARVWRIEYVRCILAVWRS